jgi:hypothetical protein
LTASYEGDSASSPSASLAVIETIGKADQTISFAALPGRTLGDPDFSLSAMASSGLPVSYSIVSGPASLTAGQVHLTGAGTVTVRASQAGDSNYNPATDVDQSFAVAVGSQIITFAPLPDRTYGDAAFDVSATGGGSSQPVVFTATGACTISGVTVTLTAPGSCTVTASQAGDANYTAAASVPRLFMINKATQAPVTVSAPSDAILGQTGLVAMAAGGSGTGTYRFSAGLSTGCAVNATTGAIAITMGGGTCSITASRLGDANYIDSSPSTPAVISIHRTCDVNYDGSVNITDLQLIINEALGTGTPLHDLNGDGLVNVIDVQADINAALGLGCSAS